MKKLIYFTLGSNKEYVKLANLCVESLYKNNYDGDFLFITNFKEIILELIFFKKDPFFLNVDETDLLLSSSNKLKIYNFNHIDNYDKIIYSDVDILWLSNPNKIFNQIIEDKFYVSNENGLMSDEYWGGRILNKNMIYHLKNVEEFLNQNNNLINVCLEQPFINVYLFRNNLYNNTLNECVSHNGYNVDSYEGTVLHFAGGPGNFEHKYNKIINYNTKNF
jgi:hypothetical protein